MLVYQRGGGFYPLMQFLLFCQTSAGLETRTLYGLCVIIYAQVLCDGVKDLSPNPKPNPNS